jgi:hypothetical protein
MERCGLRAALILSLLLGLSRADGSTSRDVLLSGYYLGKASVPLFLLPEALNDGDKVLLLDAGLFAVLTVPATGLLYQRWIGNQDNVQLWRKLNFGMDMALAGGVGLFGIYRMTQPDPNPDGPSRYVTNKFGGLLIILASGLYAGISTLELIPFASESGVASNLQLQPLVSLESGTMGILLQANL